MFETANRPERSLASRRCLLKSAFLAASSLGHYGKSSFASDSCISNAERIRLPDGRYLGIQWYGLPGGLPVLYFHGTPSSRVEASLIASDCRETGVQLVSVDRPGIGLSSHHRSHSARTWANDVRALTDRISVRLGSDQIGVLAYSGGTSFALSTAQHLPDRISAVAIIAPRVPGAPGVPAGVVDRDALRARRNPRLASMVMRRYRRRLLRSGSPLRRSQMDRFSAGDRKFAESNYHWIRHSFLEATQCGVEGIIQDISVFIWPWCVELSEIQTPVALWQGGQDHSAPVQTSTFLQQLIPCCDVTLAAPEGHLTLLKNYASEALSWLCQQLASSAIVSAAGAERDT